MRLPWSSDEANGWVYGGSPRPGWPTDLAYYVGHQICRAYYDSAADKDLALADILSIRDFESFLRQSGYAEGLN